VLHSEHGVCSGIGGRQQMLTGKEETKNKKQNKYEANKTNKHINKQQ
jgi:hypothetical protein